MKKLFAAITLGTMLLVTSVASATHYPLGGKIAEGNTFCDTAESHVRLAEIWTAEFERTGDPVMARTLVRGQFLELVAAGVCVELDEFIDVRMGEFVTEGAVMTTSGLVHYEIWSVYRLDDEKNETPLYALFIV